MTSRRYLVLLISAATFTVARAQVKSRDCAPCHSSIYETYTRTGMARTSGRASADQVGDSPKARFTHEVSGASYKVRAAQGGIELEFEKPGTEVKGIRGLEFFIGSGGRGRSFLFSAGVFLYQAPVSYYASSGSWQASPGYESKTNIDLTRPVEPACLQCHASGLRPISGTQNGFQRPPFEEGGISCERCHGPGQTHMERMRAGRANGSSGIINPRKLEPQARDSICAQCHLTGAARIARAGAKRGSFQPGEKLSTTLAVFLFMDGGDSSVSATSHYEHLTRSACKKASGDKMWCGTCHDPHLKPPEADRVSYYNQRCLSCHHDQLCSATPASRRSSGDNCIACHMPSSPARSMEHLAFTDHSIPRRKDRKAPGPVSAGMTLVPFWPEVNGREIALAYAVAAITEPKLRREALVKLEAAALQNPTDVAVLAQLAQFYDRMGREDKAAEMCALVLTLDPSHVAASVNLGTYRIKQGAADEAMRLWTAALERNPALTGTRVNLAVAQFRGGKLPEAEASLLKALHYDPDSDVARKLLADVRSAQR